MLSELYKRLADADLNISIFLSPVQNDEDKNNFKQKALESYNLFARYYLENRIYISEDISPKIDAYIKNVKENLSYNLMSRSGNSDRPELWYET